MLRRDETGQYNPKRQQEPTAAQGDSVIPSSSTRKPPHWATVIPAGLWSCNKWQIKGLRGPMSVGRANLSIRLPSPHLTDEEAEAQRGRPGFPIVVPQFPPGSHESQLQIPSPPDILGSNSPIFLEFQLCARYVPGNTGATRKHTALSCLGDSRLGHSRTQGERRPLKSRCLGGAVPSEGKEGP